MSNRIFSFTGDDNWSSYETPNEALKEMFESGDLEVGNTFLTGISRKPEPFRFMPDADEILENYENRIFDEHDWSYAEGNTGADGLSESAKKELDDFLESWANKHLTISFYEIEHDEMIIVTQEMIDAFHANQPIPLPEFKFKEHSHD